MNKRLFVIVMTIVMFICLWVTMGILSAIFNPKTTKPPTDKEQFISSCAYQQGVPDVHTNNWRCEKI